MQHSPQKKQKTQPNPQPPLSHSSPFVVSPIRSPTPSLDSSTEIMSPSIPFAPRLHSHNNTPQQPPISIKPSPHKNDNQADMPSFIQSQQSHDILISKHLPPPLMLLPKHIDNQPKSLLPMLPLPPFVGIIPSFQPLEPVCQGKIQENRVEFHWIGQAFQNVVYRKYEEASYCRIEEEEENWNIWACDVGKLTQNTKNPNAPTSQQPHGHSHSNSTHPPTQTPEPQPLLPFYTPSSAQDLTLQFQSRFQCGNLSLVSMVTPTEYNLLLQNDINTNGYSQWFFFKVSNTHRQTRIKFNIVNLYKHSSLYKSGMKIILYSTKQSQQKNLSWHRGGESIQYYQNGYSKSANDFKPFYTLSWQYVFPHTGDQVYFAYSYPFTYSNLNNFIEKIESDVVMKNYCRRTPLCKTLAGNRVDVLTITEDHPNLNVNMNGSQIEKAYIVITARIHPGETVSSYVCNGILEFLLSQNEKAKKLRQYFIFKIIPMLNPDGVIHGNYRSNISGFDLNRKWQNPSKLYHPQIYYCKKLIQNINQIGEIVLFCDLHGHSMKKNAFIYGSHDTNDARKGKEFPFLISKLFRGFSFQDCSFLKKEEKQGTTRTVLAQEVFNNNVFTLESSFCGPEYENIHFTVRHFQELGQKFCQAILLTFKDRIKQMHIQAAMRNNSAYSYIPNSHNDSQILYDSLMNFSQIDQMNLRQRVNSQNSQGSEQQNQSLTMLQQKTIKKYLILKNTRPQTSFMGRRNNFRKTMSKDLTQKYRQKKVQFNIHKSSSPTKRKQLYQPPKVDKIFKSNLHKDKDKQKQFVEKVKIEPKLFEPIQFMSVGLERQRGRRNYRSTTRLSQPLALGSQSERTLKKQQRHTGSTNNMNIKLILNKNYQFKSTSQQTPQFESVFKNSTLKSYIKQQYKKQSKQQRERDRDKQKERKISDFIIRKSKVNIINTSNEDRNSSNLFKSVLSSLRKDKK